jgi:hypothetical protein
MTNERLEQLLQNADVASTTQAVDPALAQRVRARARRQRHVRAVAGSVLGTACVVAVAAWALRPDTQITPLTPVLVLTTQSSDPAKELRAEMLALSQEADRRAAAAEALWATESSLSFQSNRTAAATQTDVAAQIERAAFTMVYQAARMPAASAAAVYREVSRAFPNTPSARVARERLTALESQKDG